MRKNQNNNNRNNKQQQQAQKQFIIYFKMKHREILMKSNQMCNFIIWIFTAWENYFPYFSWCLADYFLLSSDNTQI
jgi:hypothetical protein